MSNESSRQLVAQVQARQEQPSQWQVDISNLNIHDSVKQLIINCYLKHVPFGLSTEDGRNVVYFLPTNRCAVWCDDGNVDDYMQNVVTCTVDFRTYSGAHIVWLKFPLEILPDDLSYEALSRHPVVKMIENKGNTYVSLRVYHKPVCLVNRLRTIKTVA